MSVLRSFTFGGVDTATYKLYLAVSSQKPILPRTRDRLIEIPGRDGKIDLGADLAERIINLPCVLRVDTDTEFTIMARNIANLFNPLKGPQRLILPDQPDKYIMARYAGQLTIPEILQWGEFELPLMAADPYFYPISETAESFTVTSNNQVITITRPADSVDEYPKIRIVNNGSSAVSGITITKTS